MLKIQKDFDGRTTVLRLSGRIEAHSVAVIRSVMDDGGPNVLDLAEVTLVDIAAVQFLMGCENECVELVHCPAYVREWIARERAEIAEANPPRDN